MSEVRASGVRHGTVGSVPHRPPLRVLVVGPSHERIAAQLAGDDRVLIAATREIFEPARPEWLVEDRSGASVLADDVPPVDAVLVEYRGAPADDRSLVEQVRQAMPSVVVLFVVDCADPHRVAESVRLGGDAILLFEQLDVPTVLGAADRADGTVVLPRCAALGLAQAWPPPTQLLLSDREREVLACLAARMTNVQIASELFISRETVKTHVANLLRKLRADDRRSVVDRARRIGII